MYSREQSSQLRKAFWTAYGQYMRPIPSAEGMKVNWINYKTGYRGLYFRMDADKQRAIIAITMEQKDPILRELFYEQLLELRSYLHSELGEEWTWELDGPRGISRAYIELLNVSIFHKEDWPALISFFKKRMIKLDEFWSMGKHHFEPLA